MPQVISELRKIGLIVGREFHIAQVFRVLFRRPEGDCFRSPYPACRARSDFLHLFEVITGLDRAAQRSVRLLFLVLGFNLGKVK